MTELIIIFAVLILFAGIIILIKPDSVLVLLGRNIKRVEIHVLAVLVRFLIGVLFLLQYDHSRYPVTILILGLLSIVVAVSLAVMGRAKFVTLMEWAINTLKPYARIGGVLAVVFGGFVIHAFT